MSDTADAGTDGDALDGVLLAVEVASLVTATVALALGLDGSTAVAIPGGSVPALSTGVLLLAAAAAAAAGKSRRRSAGLRALGQGVLAVGFAVVALAGGVVLLDLGAVALTGATLGAVVAVAGANLVVLDVVR